MQVQGIFCSLVTIMPLISFLLVERIIKTCEKPPTIPPTMTDGGDGLFRMVNGMISVAQAQHNINDTKGTATYTGDWVSDYIRNDLSLMPPGCFTITYFNQERVAKTLVEGTCPLCQHKGPAGFEHLSCTEAGDVRLGYGPRF